MSVNKLFYILKNIKYYKNLTFWSNIKSEYNYVIGISEDLHTFVFYILYIAIIYNNFWVISYDATVMGYFQDGRERKTRGEIDRYLERARGIRDILAFQWSRLWYRSAHLLSLQSLVQSFQWREQQVSWVSTLVLVSWTRFPRMVRIISNLVTL